MFHNLEEFVDEYYGKPRDFTDNELVALMIGLYMSAYTDGYNRGANVLSPEHLFGYTGSPDYSNYCREWCNFVCHSKTFESQKTQETFVAVPSQDYKSYVQSVCDKWNAKVASGDVTINGARQGVLEDLGFNGPNFSEPITKVETEERKDDTMFSDSKIEYKLIETANEEQRKVMKSQAEYQTGNLVYDIQEAIESILDEMSNEDEEKTVSEETYMHRIAHLMYLPAEFAIDLTQLVNRYDDWVDRIKRGELDKDQI